MLKAIDYSTRKCTHDILKIQICTSYNKICYSIFFYIIIHMYIKLKITFNQHKNSIWKHQTNDWHKINKWIKRELQSTVSSFSALRLRTSNPCLIIRPFKKYIPLSCDVSADNRTQRVQSITIIIAPSVMLVLKDKGTAWLKCWALNSDTQQSLVNTNEDGNSLWMAM